MRLAVLTDGLELTVRDNGSAIPSEAAERLFRAPIERGEGMGIGLFNVARLAANAGFELSLAANLPGEVCFALRRQR